MNNSNSKNPAATTSWSTTTWPACRVIDQTTGPTDPSIHRSTDLPIRFRSPAPLHLVYSGPTNSSHIHPSQYQIQNTKYPI